jgi:tRNA(Ile)-lysidine synthetase-like protein
LELNPRLEEAIASAAEVFADEDELLQSLAATGAALHPALERRSLHASAVAAGLRPERKHLEQLRKLLAAGRGSLDIPGGRAIVTWDSGTQTLSTENIHPELAVPGPGSYRWRSRELRVELGTASGIRVDLDRAPFPWTLRTHRPGDRFRPGGGRIKKVADLWIDAHIPRAERKEMALLADARGELFWVEGIREGEPSQRVGSAAASFRFR